MMLPKYSFGIGDRFAHQGKALLAAVIEAKKHGVDVTPVWNKSHREHSIIGTKPSSVRAEADAAVAAAGWKDPYFVDADHINAKVVDLFVDAFNFFTLDVADFIGRQAPDDLIGQFVQRHRKYAGRVSIPRIKSAFEITQEQIRTTAAKYLAAVKEAGRLYRHIVSKKGEGKFITEVSMDETDTPQTPIELFFILAAIADEGIPIQTIAPKFTGRFNKGVDYVGDVARFATEFEQDLAVVAFAVKEFGLPANLKLSVHSGSDKFAIYPIINKAIRKFNAGLHVKTAGTTWLEELIGLAMANGEGLAIAKQIYKEAFSRIDELCGPYATVIDIDKSKLPPPTVVARWTGDEFANALRHNQSCPRYNRHLRQLLHVAYKIAAEMDAEFTDALDKCADIIAGNIMDNTYGRHIKPIFVD